MAACVARRLECKALSRMSTRQRKIRNTGRYVIPAISAAFFIYFGYHAIHGDRGMLARERFEERSVELQAQLQTLVSRREKLQHQIQLLQDGTLERDMLDERARQALNLSRPNEITIFLD